MNTGGVMKRLIAVAVLVAGLSGGLSRHAAAEDKVTLTVGLLQDMSSPNVTRRLPRAGVRRLEPPVRHAHRQVGRRLLDGSRPGRVVGGVGRRPDLHLHACARASSGPTMSRSPPTTSRTRSIARATSNGRTTTRPPSEPRRHRDRRSHRPDHELGARSEAADDGRLHRAQAHLRDARRRRDPRVRRARRRRLWPVLADDWRSGQDWTMVKNPNW